MALDLSKLIDYNILAYFKAKLDTLLGTKVDKIDGKGLSSNDYTSTEKTKLAGIAAQAQVNVLEGIQKNGQTVTITNKIANISIPTKTSEITNDSGFITGSDIPEGAAASTTSPKMDGTATIGTEMAFARGDHIHPSDTSKANLASPTFTGTPAAPTATKGTNTTQIATTAFVQTGLADKANSSDVYTKTEIDNKLSATFKPGGSVTFTNLPTLSAANLGKILNVTNSFTTTADFVEGAGKTYPAGTNVAIVDVGTSSSPSYKYDIQGSFFDLSGYVEESDLGLATTGEIDALFT